MHVFNRYLPKGAKQADVIDLGGGVGGWARCLDQARPDGFSELTLADSSEIALQMASKVLSHKITKYQIDLMNLGWEHHWDAAFLLDVIEHLPDDAGAVSQAAQALKPGGFLFVTTPAFQKFWSYHDNLSQHKRRYEKEDFKTLAKKTNLRLVDARYFMFFLSSLYLLARNKIRTGTLSVRQKKELVIKQTRTPWAPINAALSLVFSSETPMGHWVTFPLGTSVLSVFQKK